MSLTSCLHHQSHQVISGAARFTSCFQDWLVLTVRRLLAALSSPPLNPPTRPLNPQGDLQQEGSGQVWTEDTEMRAFRGQTVIKPKYEDSEL